MARGNHDGGKSLTERVRKAMTRAIKQGDAGIAGQRALSELLAELMQTDVARFIQITAPYIPKEVIIDQTISIADALQEARNRVIDMGNAQVIEQHPHSLLADQAPDNLVQLIEDDSTPVSTQHVQPEPVAISQGGVQGWAGAE